MWWRRVEARQVDGRVQEPTVRLRTQVSPTRGTAPVAWVLHLDALRTNCALEDCVAHAPLVTTSDKRRVPLQPTNRRSAWMDCSMLPLSETGAHGNEAMSMVLVVGLREGAPSAVQSSQLETMSRECRSKWLTSDADRQRI